MMPMMVPTTQMMPMMNQNDNRPRLKKSPMQEMDAKDKKGESFPPTTVFVGNITERASDVMVRQLLAKCGPVNNWKRVQGASGKLQAFGFCEYSNPESTLRAIRLLHDLQIADKKLVVKVDAKTKDLLEEYKSKKREKSGQAPPEDDSKETLDEDTLKQDEFAINAVKAVLREHEHELSKPAESETEWKKKQTYNREKKDKDEKDDRRGTTLDDVDMEEEKKNLIHREIRSFRNTYKEDQMDREQRDREQERSRERRREQRERQERLRERERRLHRSESRSRSRSPSRQRTRSRSRYRSRSRSRSRERSRTDRDKEYEDKENLEEMHERRKLERKLREKEASYQERLKNWETRERKKERDLERTREKEAERKQEEMHEARRLKEFLEDYDDDRDDPKYYKGSALSKRLKDREKEIDADNRDRQREKEELEEIKMRLMEEGAEDVDGEIEKLEQEREEHMRPRLVLVPSPITDTKPLKAEVAELNVQEGIIFPAPPFHVDEKSQTQSDDDDEGDDNDNDVNMDHVVYNNSHDDTVENQNEDKHENHDLSGKKKKLTVSDVFSRDGDESAEQAPKKRKLVPLDYSPREQLAVQKPLSAEEKKKHIKNLIEKIPTQKEELFQYQVDWTIVDSSLMERRIKPWINKKIVEYIGEEEQTLVEFICQKVMAHSSPKEILQDVSMVLDEEAEVFVVKMWRLLIYEIEAKKHGLVK